MAKRLPVEAPVVELDVTDDAQVAALADRVREHVPHLDGVVHSIGFAPQSVMGGNFMAGEWPDVATAIHISAYSLKSLAAAARPLMTGGGSIVGLTFDGRYAWPVYDWMGVAKAAFEATSRYVARDLGPEGIRCNLVSAGPIKTTAAKHIPGFDQMESGWSARAPLGWDSCRPRADGARRHRAALRLVPRDDGLGRPRRRRLPRDGTVGVMPVLVLARHAKAEAHTGPLSDHARALALRGRTDAKELGAMLSAAGLEPDVAYVSDAVRTSQTWELASGEWDVPVVHRRRELYNTTVATLVALLNGTEPGATNVMVVGHEPTMSAAGLVPCGVRVVQGGAAAHRARASHGNGRGVWSSTASGPSSVTSRQGSGRCSAVTSSGRRERPRAPLRGDDGALGDHGDAALRDGEPALEVVRAIEADGGALLEHHVLVEDRPPHLRVAVDDDVVHEDRVGDRRPRVKAHVGGQHRARDRRAGHDHAGRDDRVGGVARAGPPRSGRTSRAGA